MSAPHWRHTVRVADTDFTGTIFCARAIEWAIAAEEAAFAAAGMAMPELFASGTFITPVVHTRADFHAPLRHGMDVEARVSCSHIGTTSFTCRTVFTLPDGRPALTVEVVHACRDGAGDGIAVPPRIRSGLKAFRANAVK